ncbi:HdeD family acid-resistance protein [Joostella atrarenae]|uniref:HdeD family acid-resistance protein n=1 Tax=Joostella atrarenae TaxID=679257 RepID=A0ABS9J6D0_9FLAO|nr:HdeD family acid-resistance protein [Joostella atrarenae]MCF8715969.1 HdeD family acid-resistance protein [Joostella atrarenae]
MLRSLTKNWWALALKGIILIIFSVLIFMNPAVTATGLALWIAFLMIADGVFTIIAAIASWKEIEDKWLILLEGAVSLILGIILLNMPQLTLLIVGFTIAFWFIFGGVSRIAMGIQVRKEIKGEGWIILGGVLAVIFGLIILSAPTIGVTYVMWIMAFSALLIGIVSIIVAFKLKKGDKWLKENLEEIQG